MSNLRSLNILLIADEAIGLRAFKLILKSGHTLRGLLTSCVETHRFESHSESQSNTTQNTNPIVTLAMNLGIPVWNADYALNPYFAIWMRTRAIDVLLNVHSLHRIHLELLHATQIGAFNLHPGPLPEYSGMNTPSWAVYNQEKSYGVTIHHLSDRIDAGHIAYETRFSLTSTDTGLSVSLNCTKAGLVLLEKLLKQLSLNPIAIPSVVQDLEKRVVYKRTNIPYNGLIRWSETADKIDAFVRACNYAPFLSPWGTPKTRVLDRIVEIHSIQLTGRKSNLSPGTVGCISDDKVYISTGDRWVYITQCRLGGHLIPAKSALHKGDILF